MKQFLIPVFALAMTAPVFADAEDFGEKMLELNGSNATAATLAMAADKLSGDAVDETINLGANEIATRDATSYSAGHLRLAAEMGVSPADFTTAELSAMFIDAYN